MHVREISIHLAALNILSHFPLDFTEPKNMHARLLKERQYKFFPWKGLREPKETWAAHVILSK
jgi:hypothetical protein